MGFLSTFPPPAPSTVPVMLLTKAAYVLSACRSKILGEPLCVRPWRGWRASTGRTKGSSQKCFSKSH
jgi:hypothetical protein